MRDQHINMKNGILFDHARTARIGLPEAVFCEGKSFAAVQELMINLNNRPVLFTRLAADIFNRMPEHIRRDYNYDALSRTAFTTTLKSNSEHKVAIVSAGTADGSVSHETVRTLAYLGIKYDLFEDCGVAGLWRLTERLEQINSYDVVIAVAGLDAALASVLGGLTGQPIFAVPTSVGYGVAKEGQSALSSMLCSCAQGVAVMNIDNGYGAACAAARVVNLLEGFSHEQN